MKFSFFRFYGPFLFLVLTPPLAALDAKAQGIDLLGEVTKPLWAPAQDKAKSMTRYLWLQPYGGYASGSGSLTNTKTGQTNLSVEGPIVGARAGFTIVKTLRVGVDYTMQFAQRSEYVTNALGVRGASPENVKSRDTMMGLSGSVEIPYTPLQAYGAKYFKAKLGSDGSGGSGWGAGVSFVLKNPFILIVERRTIDYASSTSETGGRNDRNIEQYFVGLSFLLL